MSYIEINHFTKIIKKNTILSDISLNLEKGRAYGFLGINGSGKTMLFRSICGLMNATEGSISVDSITVGNGIHPKNTGLLLENADLWNELSAFENLNILNTMSNKKISKEEIKNIIADFGLDPESKKPFKSFSLGMKQKLRLAQAFMGEPELLILDEPTNALDEESKKHLTDRLLEEKKKGTTILLASHIKEDIQAVCDTIICLKNGEIEKTEDIRKGE
ncbi:MAG: ABC transporter ATP-binding protein [Eubacterium sp.]